MSSSDLAETETCSISAAGPPGVEIRVLDAHLEPVATGLGRIEEDLPPGIYTIRWIAGDQTEQQIVRLRRGQALSLEPATLQAGAAHSSDSELSARQFSALANFLSRPLEAKTELVLFTCANDANTTSDVASSIELRRIDPKTGRWKRRATVHRQRTNESDGWSYSRYELEPGPYILRYVSVNRETIEQSVEVLPRRRSVAWMRYGRIAKAEYRKGGQTLRSRRGIEPGSSRFFSLEGAVDGERLNGASLLADVLMHDLARRSGQLDDGLVDRVADCADPYLHLYAASVLLARPLKPTETWPEISPDETAAIPAGNLASAKRLLAPLFRDRRLHGWSDLLCARWRVAMAEHDQSPPDADKPLGAPPMLECAWRWATAWSVDHHVIDPEHMPGLDSVSTHQERNPPWLTWRSVADQRAAAPSPSPQSPGEDARETVRAATELSHRLQSDMAVAALSLLSPMAAELARNVLKVGAGRPWGAGGENLVNRLAGAVGLPIAHLMPAVLAALDELRQTEKRFEGSTTDLWWTDPNKGQFGGSKECRGLSIALTEIVKSNSAEYLGLKIEVSTRRGADPLDGAVTFFLHPTFNPPTISVGAIEGKAIHLCYAMGVFTVGVEASDGRRVELDLAQDKRLPKWFLER